MEIIYVLTYNSDNSPGCTHLVSLIISKRIIVINKMKKGKQ